MRGDVDTIKERLDIAEVISGYIKLEKAGANFKARCPFHSEKTPSFFISPARQSYYCFGCGAKGDIFTFVESVEGVDFKGALKFLAEKAGVELEYRAEGVSKAEKDKLFSVLEAATLFFENELKEENGARDYILSRGINDDSIKKWRLGYAKPEWRALHNHLREVGFDRETIIKAGLAKLGEKGGEPYDVFRNRIIFPLLDTNSRVIAFSGRAMPVADTEGPKYLNSPDTMLFTKSEVLYGLDKAKQEIRRRNFAVLVEGQMDLVMSHQAGVTNTVASSGTAFTRTHLERLKPLSQRIIIAFDADSAGEKAAERSAELGLSLGFDVKVANLPEGKDPADLAYKGVEDWKNVLRESKPAVEHFFNIIEQKEKDARKLGKLVEQKILPMIKMINSAMEQSHFVSMIARRTGIKEEIIAEDLKKIKLEKPSVQGREATSIESRPKPNRREELQDVTAWLAEDPKNQDLLKQKDELSRLIRIDEIDEELMNLRPGNEVDHKRKFELIKERDTLRR